MIFGGRLRADFGRPFFDSIFGAGICAYIQDLGGEKTVKKRCKKVSKKALTIVVCGAILTEHFGKERKRTKSKTLKDLKKVLDKY